MKRTKSRPTASSLHPGTLAKSLALAALALGAGPALASVDTTTGQVGEVRLVLGKAWLERAGGGRERIRVGTLILPSDVIETTTNGHVHILFIDQALVSIRPSSTLEIVRYDYDPQSPDKSAIRLNLVEGVTRAISGKAAKEARDKFRLNTPIAAIGVRGTDFVVSANQSSVRALVNEGAIVMAPYSSQCLVDALGPCSLNGIELVGGINQILQFNANSSDPVLLPLPAAGVTEAMLGQQDVQSLQNMQSAAARERDDANNGELYTETVTARAVNPRIAQSAKAPQPLPQPLPQPQPQPQPEVPKIIYTPALALAPEQLTDNQLVWGRWTEGDLRDERITVAYSTAIAFGHKGAVGNNKYALYRIENGTTRVQPGLGVLGFNLLHAQAHYRFDGNSSLMDVSDGTLSIDFYQNTYATTLNLNHAATGAISLQDSGRIYSGGYFNTRVPGQVTAGAVSLDGKEAGYFFEKILEQGSIDGLTLWGRQP
jgi:hypothetical protein